jgi:hypothetical protein
MTSATVFEVPSPSSSVSAGDWVSRYITDGNKEKMRSVGKEWSSAALNFENAFNGQPEEDRVVHEASVNH